MAERFEPIDMVFHSTARDLATAATDFLEKHEAEHGMLLGRIAAAARDVNPTPVPRFLLEIREASQTRAVAFYQERALFASVGAGRYADAIAESLAQANVDIPAVHGLAEDAEAIATAWCRVRGRSPVLLMDHRLYRLTKVVWPSGITGRLRPMSDEDVDLVARWLLEFQREALPNEPLDPVEARKHAAARPAMKLTYLWETTDTCVAMASLSRPSKRGITVNAVYTPPENRGRGYASALVAAVSQEGLSRGKDFCVLYTDLTNPTSNSIYQKVGYVPIADARLYETASHSGEPDS